jgi:manganese/zinc/iron transport system permease protein
MEYLKDLMYFFSFIDISLNIVILGTIILGVVSGLVGVLTVLSHRALIVDAISHSILPGVCIGFVLSGTKNPLYLIIGGLFSGFLSVLAVNFISQKSKIKTDSAIAIVLSTFFSLGVLILNFIQNSDNHNQTGLSDFLFGKANALISYDIKVFLILLIFILLVIWISFKSLKIYLFDSIFASSIGLPIFILQSVLTISIILITAIGVQTVGVVLMSALLVSPATSALLWQKKLHIVLLWAAIFSAISALLGVVISYIFPFFPTGPSIVIILSLITFFSVIFSPHSKFKRKKSKGYSFYQN